MLGSVTISKRLAYSMNKNDIIPSKYIPHYQFCFEYLLENLFFISSILIIGCVIQEFTAAFTFLSVIIPMRSFCGGMHASSKNRCTFFSYLIFFVYMGLYYIMNIIPVSPIAVAFIFVFCMFTLLILGPVDTAAKRFTSIQKEKMHSFCRSYGILIMIVYLLFYYNDNTVICNSIFISTAIVLAGAIAAGIINQKARKEIPL